MNMVIALYIVKQKHEDTMQQPVRHVNTFPTYACTQQYTCTQRIVLFLQFKSGATQVLQLSKPFTRGHKTWTEFYL